MGVSAREREEEGGKPPGIGVVRCRADSLAVAAPVVRAEATMSGAVPPPGAPSASGVAGTRVPNETGATSARSLPPEPEKMGPESPVGWPHASAGKGRMRCLWECAAAVGGTAVPGTCDGSPRGGKSEWPRRI